MTRLVKFRPNHWKDLTESEIASLKNIGCVVKDPPDKWGEYTAPIDKVLTLPFEVVISKVNVAPDVIFEITDRLCAIEHRLDAINANGQTYNERCSVHVPGIGLLLISKVLLLEDCCTDKLQEYLEDGWRIIAACPQPDQRRPDYILGRSEEPKLS